MSLSPERELRTTASQAPVICNGNATELLQLWRERIGEVQPEDLSRSLPVQLGRLLEPWLLDWLEVETGNEITERQLFIVHPTHPKYSCTIDGYRAFDDAVIEMKVLGPWRRRQEFLTWYTPQVVVQRDCRECSRGVLAVLQGNARIDTYEIKTTPKYEHEVFDRLEAFQICVDTLTPPVPLPELVPPEQWRTIDLAASEPLPNWAMPMIQSLRLWSDTRDAVKLHTQAKEDIKALLPDDVGRVVYGDMLVRRAKNNAVTVLEQEFSL